MKRIIGLLLIALLTGNLLTTAVSAAEVIVTAQSAGYRETGNKAGTFQPSSLKDCNGEATRYASGEGDNMIYTPELPQAGNYLVSYYIVKSDTSDGAQPLSVTGKDGTQHFEVDCLGEEGWVDIGIFAFEQGQNGNVTTTRPHPGGAKPYMRSGGVKFTLTEQEPQALLPLVQESSGPSSAAKDQLPDKEMPTQGYVMAEFYVSPLVQEMGDGTKERPFSALEQAREAVRKINQQMTGDIVVYLEGGVYNLDTPLILGPEDGGTNGYQVIYRNAEGQSPVLEGGKEYTGFTLFENNIYQMEVGKGLDFRQIYVDGTKGQRARTPNLGETLELKEERTETGLLVQKGLLDGLETLDGVEVNVLNSFMHKRFPIIGVKEAGNWTEAVVKPTVYQTYQEKPQSSKDVKGKAYWVENAMAFLDQPGEWYYNQEEGVLYYMPYSGQNAESATVVIPDLENLMVLDGTMERPVQNMTVQGITFRHTNWRYANENGIVDMQANFLIPPADQLVNNSEARYGFEKARMESALRINQGDTIVVRDCVFQDLGGVGLSFRGGGKYFYIQGNVFDNIAGSGVEIGEDYLNPADTRWYSSQVMIDNNYVQNVANEYYGGIGILVTVADKLTITNNYLRDLSYTGINAGWGWSPTEAVPENRDYTIRGNRVEDYGKRLTDCGGIYIPNPVAGANVVEENAVLGNGGSLGNRVVMGIYHDGAASNMLTQKNVVEFVQNWWIGGASFGGQSKKDILAQNNYTTKETARLLEGVTPEMNVTVQNTVVQEDARWPQEALDIIQQAGLTEAYQQLTQKADFLRITPLVSYLYAGETTEIQVEADDSCQVAFENPYDDLMVEQTGSGDPAADLIEALQQGLDQEETNGKTVLLVDCPNGLADGKNKRIDPENEAVAPRVVNDRTLLPVRFLADSIGAQVEWEEAAQTATLIQGEDRIVIRLGEPFFTLNGAQIELDVPADTMEDRMMLPLRSITEALGKKVYWDDRGLIVISDRLNPFGGGSLRVTMPDKPKEVLYRIPVTITKPSGQWVREEIAVVTKDLSVSVVVSTSDAGYTEQGTFAASSLTGFAGKSRYSTTIGPDTYAEYKPAKLEPGTYQVYVYNIVNPSSDAAGSIEVMAAGQPQAPVIMDGTVGETGWFYVGTYQFDGSGNEYVRQVNSGTGERDEKGPKSGFTRTDSVKFVLEQD